MSVDCDVYRPWNGLWQYDLVHPAGGRGKAVAVKVKGRVRDQLGNVEVGIANAVGKRERTRLVENEVSALLTPC